MENVKKQWKRTVGMTAYPSRGSINFHYCFLMVYNDTVRTLFWRKNSRTFQGHFPIFKGLHSVQKRALSLCVFIKVLPQHEQSWRSWCLLLVGIWESGFDKVSTEIRGNSITDSNFQRLWRPWIFKVRANRPVIRPATAVSTQLFSTK